MKIMPDAEPSTSVARGCSTRVSRVIAGVPPAMVAFAPWPLGIKICANQRNLRTSLVAVSGSASLPSFPSVKTRPRFGIHPCHPCNPWLNQKITPDCT